SAYRIVQEGLTNTLKHAAARHADVELCFTPADLVVEVRDDGRGRAAGRSNGTSGRSGYGLVGIRERVSIFGGEMSAGPRTGDGDVGFVLHARLPVEAFGP